MVTKAEDKIPLSWRIMVAGCGSGCLFQLRKCCNHPARAEKRTMPLNLCRRGECFPRHCPLVRIGPTVVIAVPQTPVGQLLAGQDREAAQQWQKRAELLRGVLLSEPDSEDREDKLSLLHDAWPGWVPRDEPKQDEAKKDDEDRPDS